MRRRILKKTVGLMLALTMALGILPGMTPKALAGNVNYGGAIAGVKYEIDLTALYRTFGGKYATLDPATPGFDLRQGFIQPSTSSVKAELYYPGATSPLGYSGCSDHYNAGHDKIYLLANEAGDYHFMITNGEWGYDPDYGNNTLINMNFTQVTVTVVDLSPIVAATAATNVTDSCGTLNGTVNANGENSAVTFEYGTSTSYGSTVTPSQSPVTGSADTTVSASLTGLAPNTTYHYRVAAINKYGTKRSGDSAFTTSKVAPAVTTGGAGSITSSGVTLSGTVNAHNDSTAVTFQYGTTTAYESSITAKTVTGNTPILVSKSITGLMANTTYHYRAVGVSSAFTTNGDDATFDTLRSAPAAVTNAATGITSSGATLTGTVNAKNENTTITFEYGPDTAYVASVAATPGTASGSGDATVTYTLTGLEPNTTCHYQVKAVNGTGTTPGGDQSFTTLPIVPIVTTGSASGITADEATLNSTVVANNADTDIQFEYGTDISYGTKVAAGPSPATGFTLAAARAVLTKLIPNTTYHFRVIGTNAAGTVNGDDATFTTAKARPSATTDAAGDITTTSATMHGTVNARNDSTTITFEYGLTAEYGNIAAATPGGATGTGDTKVSCTLTGLATNSTYHYRVAAVNSSGTTYGEDQFFLTNALAPTVTTGSAGGITATGAILGGKVNPNNAETTVTFEYGTTDTYGSAATASQSPVTGTTETDVSADITELHPNSTYHFRAVGENRGGAIEGGDATFTTLKAAPAAATQAATGVNGTEAVLNGTVNASNEITTVTFEYGTDSSYGSTGTASQSPVTGIENKGVSYTLTELTPNTAYHFRVKAVNDTGTTFGDDQTFTTSKVLPEVTTRSVIADSITFSGATLSGLVNAKNDSTAVTFEYGLTAECGSTIAASPSPVTGTIDTTVSAALTELDPNATYHFRAVGINGAGEKKGDDLTFTTDKKAPNTITNAATDVLSTGATVNGTVNACNESTTVTFEYGTTLGYGSTVTASQSPATGATDTQVSYTLTELIPNTTFHFRVKAVNGTGTAIGEDQTFTTPKALPAVTTGSAGSISFEGATLSGTVDAKNDSTAVTFEYGLTNTYGYTIAASPSPVTGSGGSGTPVSAVLTCLQPNATYHFRVVAINGAGEKKGEDQTFTTGKKAPAAATNAATDVFGTGATLNGSVNACNESTAVTFEYGPTTAYGSTGTAIQSPVTGALNKAVSCMLTGLAPNTTYHFRVKAVNGTGESLGEDRTFTTLKVLPAVLTGGAGSITSDGATLSGTVNAKNDSTEVKFEYGATDTYGSVIPAKESPVTGESDTAVSADVTGLDPNSTYHFRAVGKNSKGTVNGDDKTFTTDKEVPGATTCEATVVTSTGATLGGTVNASNESTTVTFQYGKTTAYGDTVTAAQSPASGTKDTPVSFALTGLDPNTAYHFRVRAHNSTGTTYGGDQTFTTLYMAPAATAEDAGSITPYAAVLHGKVNANQDSTTVKFEYGLTDSYGSTIAAEESPVTGLSGNNVSANLTDLLPNTTYHYRVSAMNNGGTTNSGDITFSTAKSKPAAAADAASNITAFGATVNAKVNAKNESTDVTFEYGKTTAYGFTATAAESPVSGTGDTAVSSALTCLDPNTVYHYRVAAENGTGTTRSEDKTFTTGTSAPAVSTAAATDITTTVATLSGTVNARNESTVVTFEYGTTVSYGSSITAKSPVTGVSDKAVSYAINGLVPNTLYHYRVAAENGAGTTYGDDVAFTTGKTVPEVITGAAGGITPTGATLTGTVNAKNDTTAVTFEYGVDTSYGNTAAAAQSPVTGLTDTFAGCTLSGLEPNTVYHFRVVGENTSGRTQGDDKTFATPYQPDVTLTADTTKNNVDNPLEITFIPNADFESRVTSVTFGETALTAKTDYTVSSGKITLLPRGGNKALQTPAKESVVVTAKGYRDTTVAQVITAGVAATITVTSQPVPGHKSGTAFDIQPSVILKDRYGNICKNGPSAAALVTASALPGTGEWALGGTTEKEAVKGVATFSDLTVTVLTSGTGSMAFAADTVTAGSNPFAIPENNSSIAPASVSFDKYSNSASYREIPVRVTFNGNTLLAIQREGQALTEGTDYVVTQNGITLLSSCLSRLPIGPTQLLFNFSFGQDLTLAIVVSDSTPTGAVVVNGQAQGVGEVSTTEEDGQTTTTVTVDDNLLQQALNQGVPDATVVISVNDGADVSSVVLGGQTVSSLTSTGTSLQVQTQTSTYTLPSGGIDMGIIGQQLGQDVPLSEIQVNVSISEPPAETVQVLENAAASGEFQIMVPAVEFTVSCSYGGQTVEVSTFNAYTERTVEIPEGVDPHKITTGVVLKPDGTIYPVPTRIVEINGKYYAVMNSLTNSAYAVISHPVEFSDVGSHWARDAINDLGSRMIVTEAEGKNYAPDAKITRADFAADLIRALGIAPGLGTNPFGDVKETDWYYGYMTSAVKYGFVGASGETLFQAEEPVTRAEALMMLSKALNIAGIGTALTEDETGRLLSAYKEEENVPEAAKAAAAACLKAEVAFAPVNGQLMLTQPVTRAEAAVILKQLLQKAGIL